LMFFISFSSSIMIAFSSRLELFWRETFSICFIWFSRSYAYLVRIVNSSYWFSIWSFILLISLKYKSFVLAKLLLYKTSWFCCNYSLSLVFSSMIFFSSSICSE
jgi:hypothetical protein